MYLFRGLGLTKSVHVFLKSRIDLGLKDHIVNSVLPLCVKGDRKAIMAHIKAVAQVLFIFKVVHTTYILAGSRHEKAPEGGVSDATHRVRSLIRGLSLTERLVVQIGFVALVLALFTTGRRVPVLISLNMRLVFHDFL